MRLAVFHGSFCVLNNVLAVHRLQEIVVGLDVVKPLRHRIWLWKYKLEFISALDTDWCRAFWADSDPINSRGWFKSAVSFDSALEAESMQAAYEGFIELQQGFTTREHNQAILSDLMRPEIRDLVRKRTIVKILASVDSVSPYEVGIAKSALGGGPILFAP